jgi:hypothetical protein
MNANNLNARRIQERETDERNYMEYIRKISTENIPVTVHYMGRPLFRLYFYFNSMTYDEFERMLLFLIKKDIEFIWKFSRHTDSVKRGGKWQVITFLCYYHKDGKCRLEGKTRTRRNWQLHYPSCNDPDLCIFSKVIEDGDDNLKTKTKQNGLRCEIGECHPESCDECEGIGLGDGE